MYGFGLAGSGDSTLSDSSNNGVVSSFPSRDYEIVGEDSFYNDLGAEGKTVFIDTTQTVIISNIEDIMLDIDPSYTSYDAVIYHFRNPNTADEGLCTTVNTVGGSGMMAASTNIAVEGQSVALNYGLKMFYLDPGDYICEE